MRQALLFIVFIFLGAWFIYMNSRRTSVANKEALEDLNLNLTGVVESVENGNGFHGYGIVRLKVIESNISDYDPRGTRKYFFCVIKNGMAEIYDHASTGNTYIGDTLVYHTKEKINGIIRNGKLYEEGSISVSTEDNYYQFVRQKTIFK